MPYNGVETVFSVCIPVDPVQYTILLQRFIFYQVQTTKRETSVYLFCLICPHSKKKKNKDGKRKATDEDAKPDIVGMFI